MVFDTVYWVVIDGVCLPSCVWDGSGGGSGGSSLSTFEVNLTFASIRGGFRIGNQYHFGDLVALKTPQPVKAGR